VYLIGTLEKYESGYMVDVSLVTCGYLTAVERACILAIWPDDA
jgi:hypothetical protein